MATHVTDVIVPGLGESITEATVLEWLVAVGDAVAVDQELIALETDKVTVNVPSPVAGVLVEQVVAIDAVIQIGSVVARVDTDAVAGGAGTGAAATPPEPGEAVITTAPASTPTGSNAILMPAARRLAAEQGIDPSGVTGTGRGGRILKEDLLDKSAPRPDTAELPKVPLAPGLADRREEVVRMSRLRRTIARRLVEAQQTAAMLTTFNEIDMSAVIALRKRYKVPFADTHGAKLGFMSFFAKAVVEGLKAYPTVNSEIRGEDVVYKSYYDIGVAVGGGRGLVVPVVRDVDQLGFADFEKALGELAGRAQDNTLKLSDLQGGTFTISNGGVYGSMLSTPILNPPQVGILGLHKIEQRPVAVDGQVEVRPMMYVALSYDHRIVDGREAVGFLVRVKEAIEDPARILLEI